MQPLEVTFYTDGTGVVWDLHEPHHLDALLAYHVRALAGRSLDCDPAVPPEEDEIPCARWEIGGQWGWRASALFPEGDFVQSVQWARRRFDETRMDRQGNPVVNTAAGPCKTTNRPWPLIMARVWRAWCVGDAAALRPLLENVRALGRERGRGRGRIVRYEVNPIASDWSMVRAGRAMRYLPQPGGQRVARCRPPYWHTHDRCAVTSVGEEMECSRV